METSGEPSPKRCFHTAVLVGERIIIYGGEDEDGNTRQDAFCLDPATGRWAKYEITKAYSRAMHTSNTFVVGSHLSMMVSLGGYQNDFRVFGRQSLRTLSVCNVVSTRQGPWFHFKVKNPQANGTSLPRRSGHTCTYYQGNLILIGGSIKTSSIFVRLSV